MDKGMASSVELQKCFACKILKVLCMSPIILPLMLMCQLLLYNVMCDANSFGLDIKELLGYVLK